MLKKVISIRVINYVSYIYKTINDIKHLIFIIPLFLILSNLNAQNQTNQDIISSIDFYHSSTNMSVTTTTQSTTYDKKGNIISTTSPREIYYEISKPGNIKVIKTVGSNKYIQSRADKKETVKINNNMTVKRDKKGIKDLMPEPNILFNLTEYLKQFEVDVSGNTQTKFKLIAKSKSKFGKEKIEFNVENNQIKYITFFDSKGAINSDIDLIEYGAVGSYKIPTKIAIDIYSKQTTIKKQITYNFEKLD